jgi:ABC-type enterochelin transport system permease subunit
VHFLIQIVHIFFHICMESNFSFTVVNHFLFGHVLMLWIFVTGERTRILVAILMMFILKELPHGILGFLSVILGEESFKICYERLSNLMDILTLSTNALYFPVYYITSSQFRAAFNLLVQRAPRCSHIQQQADIIMDGETHNTNQQQL